MSFDTAPIVRAHGIDPVYQGFGFTFKTLEPHPAFKRQFQFRRIENVNNMPRQALPCEVHNRVAHLRNRLQKVAEEYHMRIHRKLAMDG